MSVRNNLSDLSVNSLQRQKGVLLYISIDKLQGLPFPLYIGKDESVRSRTLHRKFGGRMELSYKPIKTGMKRKMSRKKIDNALTIMLKY